MGAMMVTRETTEATVAQLIGNRTDSAPRSKAPPPLPSGQDLVPPPSSMGEGSTRWASVRMLQYDGAGAGSFTRAGLSSRQRRNLLRPGGIKGAARGESCEALDLGTDGREVCRAGVEASVAEDVGEVGVSGVAAVLGASSGMGWR